MTLDPLGPSPVPPVTSSSVRRAGEFKFSPAPPVTSSSVPSRWEIQVQSRPSRLQPRISSCGRRRPAISSCGWRRAGFQVEPVPSHLQPSGFKLGPVRVPFSPGISRGPRPSTGGTGAAGPTRNQLYPPARVVPAAPVPPVPGRGPRLIFLSNGTRTGPNLNPEGCR